MSHPNGRIPKFMVTTGLAAFMALSAPGALMAQSASGQNDATAFLPPPAEEMQALAWLEGRWEGDGWMEQAGQRMPFRGGETVEWRMGERLLLVEGAFTAGAEGVPVHQALGIFSWDPAGGRYTFRTYTAQGDATGEAHEAVVTDGQVEWGFAVPGGPTLRFTISHTEDDLWVEEGHFSMDGATWQKFFEMRLRRVD